MPVRANYPDNRIPGREESASVTNNAYLVIEEASLNITGVPSARASVYQSEAYFNAGGAIPLNVETVNFAMIVNENGTALSEVPADNRTYVVNIDDNSIYAPLQAGPGDVADAISTAEIYVAALFGGTVI